MTPLGWAAFETWLRDEQHYAPTTVRNRLRDLRAFLADAGVYDRAPSRARKNQYRLAVDDLHSFAGEMTSKFRAKHIERLPMVPPVAPPETRHERRKKKKAQGPRMPMEAKHLQAIHSRAAQLSTHHPCFTVIYVMTETAFRVGDVLRLPYVDLREGFIRDDGVFPILVKGEKHTLASVRASEGWHHLLLHMDASTRKCVNVAEAVTPGHPDPSAGMAAYKAVYRSLRAICTDAKVPTVSPHKLRHAVATWFRRETSASRSDVRDLLVHETEAQGSAYLDGAGGNPSRVADQLRTFNRDFYKEG